jgi:hypothetical protein
MLMLSGEHWHCMDPECHCHIFVKVSSTIEGHNPCCACGQIMKKNYSPPVFRKYLDFLRTEEAAMSRSEARED